MTRDETASGSRDPDLFDLELRLAGAMDDAASADRAAAIDRDPRFDEARAEIDEVAAWWARARPPLTHRTPRRVAASGRSHRWVGLAVATGLALAAGALVVARPVGVERAGTFNARGGDGLELVRSRAGAPVPREQPIQVGDQLQVGLYVEDAGYVSVTTVQEDGAVSLLAVGVPVEGGRIFQMNGRVALDAYAGREWLVVERSEVPPSTIALEDGIRALLPRPEPDRDPERHRWVLEITRGRALEPAPR